MADNPFTGMFGNSPRPLAKETVDPNNPFSGMFEPQVGPSFREYTDTGERMVDEDVNDLPAVSLTEGMDFGSRAAMSLGQTEEEQVNIFRKMYPGGEIKKVLFRQPPPNIEGSGYVDPYENALMFKYKKEDRNERWKPIDPYVMRGTDIGEIADHMDSLIYAATGGGTGFLTRNAPLLARYASQAVTAATTRLGIDLGQEAAGVQAETPEQIAAGTGQEAVFAVGGETVASVVGKIINRGRAGGKIDPSKYLPENYLQSRAQKEMMEATEGTELKELPSMLTSYGKGPMKMLYRFGARSGFGEEQAIQMHHSAYKELKSMVDTPPDVLDEQILKTARDGYNRELGAIRSKVHEKTLKRKEGVEAAGKAVNEAMDDFVKISREETGELYKEVDELGGGVSIGIQDAKDVAVKIVEGIKASGEGLYKNVDVMDPNLGELSSVATDLIKMAPDQSYEAIKTLRTRLFNLIDNDAWGWRYSNKQAADLWNSLSDSMMKESTDQLQQGVTGGAAPEFTNALRKAGKAHRARMNVFESLKVRRMLKAEGNDTIANVGEMLMQPHTLTPQMKRLIDKYSPQKWDTIRGYVYHRVIDDNNPIGMLDKWKLRNPDSYKRMFPKNEEHVLRTAATNVKRLKSSAFSRMAEQNTEMGGQIYSLIEVNKVPEAMHLISQFPDKKLAEMSVIQHMLMKSTGTLRGKEVVNPGSFENMLVSLQESGIASKVFRPETLKRLKNVDHYLEVLQSSDSGVGIAEGAMGKGLMDFTHPVSAFGALTSFMKNSMMARAMVPGGNIDKFNKWMINNKIEKAGKEPWPQLPISMVGILAKEAVKANDPVKHGRVPSTEEVTPRGQMIPKKSFGASPAPQAQVPPLSSGPTPPVLGPTAAPSPRTAPPVGQTTYLPPSMRSPQGIMGVAAQRKFGV
jgi:hypothetical protein